ncbi:hypothetical protein [Blastococcus brunescens]|uniref:DivIVA domain-containing protein n=1 Tax=Blastococcus brunescens TaxID=1564165 RepID=A0ABZ1AUW0_9ACTN|nr:hypothetical protein [Blastococcus sp. BMG 8361]WRL61716.1 hypothetical protein U6N30_16380 [Blastococcus sp. BMG 8361]
MVDADGESGRASGTSPQAPNIRGDLEELMDHRPVFRLRLQGYDRLEVDNYTAWAEGELIAVRRQVDHLLSRFGECSAELEISRRLLADAPRGRESFPVSERVQEMLRLASDEASALTEAGAREAERIVADARTEADARLRKAHQIKELAVDAADELLEHARRDRATAAAAIDRAEGRRRTSCGRQPRNGIGWPRRPPATGNARRPTPRRSWPPCRRRSRTSAANGTRRGSRCAS